MTSSQHSARKAGNELASDPQLMVEEKIVKVSGETTVRKYAKGRFLGKVIKLTIDIGRVCTLL